jgi:hypothetical protein
MTTPLRSSLLFDDPGELIAAIPGLLRFAPTDSVVLITYTGRGEHSLEAVLRMDLPEPEHVGDVAAQLRMVALNHDATVIELVVFGGGEATPPDLPHRALVDELADVLDRAGIVLAHAVWSPSAARDRTWWCYEDPECSGQIRDPASSAVSAAVSVTGEVTFASREELAAVLAPDPPDILARRAELLATLPAVVPETEFPFIRNTIDKISTSSGHEPALDDGTIARLTHALSCSDVREACLAFALTVRTGPAERLWTVLTRSAPAPARAGPATLLAVCAYLRGDGTLAGIAIEAALTADPDHKLATIVRRITDCGLPPNKFRTMLAHSFVSAFTER